MLIACPTCGRLQFDMDTVVAEVERRLEAYDDPIEVSVLGCAVNGIGEARHADFGITGAKDAGVIYSKGKMIRKVRTENLVDELFAEIDKYYAAGKRVVRDERAAAEAEQWLAENEDATAMTPERMAAMEAAAAQPRRGCLAGRGPSLHAAPEACGSAQRGWLGPANERARLGAFSSGFPRAGCALARAAANPSATLAQLTTFHHASR